MNLFSNNWPTAKTKSAITESKLVRNILCEQYQVPGEQINYHPQSWHYVEKLKQTNTHTSLYLVHNLKKKPQRNNKKKTPVVFKAFILEALLLKKRVILTSIITISDPYLKIYLAGNLEWNSFVMQDERKTKPIPIKQHKNEEALCI